MTILELLLTISLITIIFSVVVLLISPGSFKDRARDEKKLSDLYTFESEINEYMLNFGVYPDSPPPYEVTYSHNGKRYELNVTLEYYLEKSQNDGGNNPDVFESGNDLTLI